MKNGQTPATFSFIFDLFKQTIQFFTTNQCEKNIMSIQYMVPGFEPMTFGHECPPITTRPGLPPLKRSCLRLLSLTILTLKISLFIIEETVLLLSWIILTLKISLFFVEVTVLPFKLDHFDVDNNFFIIEESVLPFKLDHFDVENNFFHH